MFLLFTGDKEEEKFMAVPRSVLISRSLSLLLD